MSHTNTQVGLLVRGKGLSQIEECPLVLNDEEEEGAGGGGGGKKKEGGGGGRGGGGGGGGVKEKNVMYGCARSVSSRINGHLFRKVELVGDGPARLRNVCVCVCECECECEFKCVGR